MKRLSTLVPLLIILSARQVHSQTAPEPETVRLQPSPEMQRLLNAFAGNWTVSETFEVRRLLPKLRFPAPSTYPIARSTQNQPLD